MLDRFKEGSSHAAIAGALAAILPTLGLPQPYIAAIVSVFAAIGFALKDKK